MTFHIITLFPGMFESYLGDSILARAIANKKIKIKFYNPRDYAKDTRKTVDDRPYGGGPGMVMMAEPVLRAVKATKTEKKKRKVIIFSPGGTELTNTYADGLLKKKITDVVLICGRYEGIDGRVKKILRAEDVSIGNYVLTGGELPAMIVVDAMARRIPGVLGKHVSVEENRIASHETYTRPPELVFNKKKYKVPPVLLSGDHKKIDEWRSER